MHELDVSIELIKKINEAVVKNNLLKLNKTKSNKAKDISSNVADDKKEKVQKRAKKNIYVNVLIGKMSGYVEDPIRFYFDNLVKDDKILSKFNMVLKIQFEKAKIKCSQCKNIKEINELTDVYCDDCGSMDCDIISGKDLIIKSIEF